MSEFYVESAKPLIKTYTKKNGDVVIKEYNQREYNKRFYEKNKEKLAVKVKCNCGGGYTSPNKTKHEESRIHKLWINYMEKIKAEVENI
jgi:hypothetical protein